VEPLCLLMIRLLCKFYSPLVHILAWKDEQSKLFVRQKYDIVLLPHPRSSIIFTLRPQHDIMLLSLFYCHKLMHVIHFHVIVNGKNKYELSIVLGVDSQLVQRQSK
jgi:hypothetical protein